MVNMHRCALCGMDFDYEPYRLAVQVLRKGDKPDTVAQTRSLCQPCARPEALAGLQSTLRRLPTILDNQ